MGILDRILLAVYAIALAILSLGAIVLCTQWISADFLWTNLTYLRGRWETMAGAAVFFLASLRLLKVSFQREKKAQRPVETVVTRGEMGEVNVAVDAVRELACRSARAVAGVRDAVVDVLGVTAQPDGQEARLRLKITAQIGGEHQVVAVSDEVRRKVLESLAHVAGLTAVDLDVLVDDMSDDSAKGRVV